MFGIVAPVADVGSKDVENALAILAVVGNADKHKKRLDELNTLAAQVNAAIKDAEGKFAAAEAAKKVAEGALVEATKLKQEADATKEATEARYEAAKRALDHRETLLSNDKFDFDATVKETKASLAGIAAANETAAIARERALNDWEASKVEALTSKEKNLDKLANEYAKKEQKLAVAEKACQTRAAELEARAAEVAKQEADLVARFNKLRSLLG